MKQNEKQTKRGFTLVELLVVIAIIAILASVSVVGYLGFASNAKDSKALTELTEYKTTAVSKLADGTEEVTLYVEDSNDSKVLHLKQYEGEEEIAYDELKITFTSDGKSLSFTPTDTTGFADAESLDEFAVAALMDLEDASLLEVVKSGETMGSVSKITYDPYNNDKNTASWTILTGDVINEKK